MKTLQCNSGFWKSGLALLVILLLSSLVSGATYYMSVSSVSVLTSSPYITNQYSIDIRVTYSAPSGISVTNCRAKVSSLPSGWAVLDNYNTNYKTLSTCSGTTTFEIMPTSTGTFSGSDIVVEVTGTDSSGQNTVNSGTGSPSGTLVVKNQPVLGLTANITPSNITNSSIPITLDYQITNTGGASTADTSNLRLIVSSTPYNAIVFSNGVTTVSIGTEVLPGGLISGTTTLNTTSSAVGNTLSYTIRATADNTNQESSKTGSLSCSICGAGIYNIILTSGWNLISLPLSP